MLISLALAVGLNQAVVEAKQYTIQLNGPMYMALINWGDIEKAIQCRDAGRPRPILIITTKYLTRCDTGKAVSVVKNGDNYYFLHHGTMQALILTGDIGKSAACATTPFWPEAFGDKPSLNALEVHAKTSKAVLERSVEDQEWFYVPAQQSETQITLRVSTRTGIAIPNQRISIHYSDRRFLDVHWWANNDYLREGAVPETITVSETLFTVPSTYLIYAPTALPGATVIDQKGIEKFLERFPIQAAFPRTLLPGQF